MYVSQVWNASLLSVIRMLCDKSKNGCTTIEEIKVNYLPATQNGVLHGCVVTFDDDLRVLQQEKLIIIDGNTIKPIQ
ncbi:MAG: hypothetical protein VB018_13860 [Lachnospiraceae bacterium]|nr:hypothetical protein [Lachnospiraceae bacterium]